MLCGKWTRSVDVAKRAETPRKEADRLSQVFARADAGQGRPAGFCESSEEALIPGGDEPAIENEPGNGARRKATRTEAKAKRSGWLRVTR